MVIVTLFHRRSFAQTFPTPEEPELPRVYPNPEEPGGGYVPQGILVSSALTCQSMHGNTISQVTVLDSVSHVPVSRVDCVRS